MARTASLTRLSVATPPLDGGADYSRAEGLGQDEPVSRPGAPVQEDLIGMGDSRHGEAVFGLVVLDAVPADQEDARLPHLVQPAPENVPQDGNIEFIDGKADDVHRCQGIAPHGIDIAEGVGHGDLAEGVRVIDYGGEEIHRLDNRQIVAEFIDPGVFGVFHPGQEMGIRHEG